MNLVVVGTNHRYSPIEVREKLSFSKKELKPALTILRASGEIPAAVILSTCNRTEIYADAVDTRAGINILKDFLGRYHHQELAWLEQYLYTYIGKEAALHLFGVTCGLDSQVIGEQQIQGQLALAYQAAEETGSSNAFLARVFGLAQATARLIRSTTQISKGDISLGSLAVNLIKEKVGDLKDKKMLVIGTGKIAELVIRNLSRQGSNLTLVANRNFKKALVLAENAKAGVLELSRLAERLKDADIIISATSSPHTILKKEDFLGTQKPQLILDLALPRDVAQDVKDIEGISLFCLDDLDSQIDKDLSQRIEAIPVAEEIIKKEAEKLCLGGCLEQEPALARLP